MVENNRFLLAEFRLDGYPDLLEGIWLLEISAGPQSLGLPDPIGF